MGRANSEEGQVAPVTAVRGNTDDKWARDHGLADTATWHAGAVRFVMHHGDRIRHAILHGWPYCTATGIRHVLAEDGACDSKMRVCCMCGPWAVCVQTRV